MVLQVKIPNIYYIDDHHPDSATEWMKCKIKYGGKILAKKQLIFIYHTVVNYKFQRSYIGNLLYTKHTQT